jgi:GNAT superfamily N-acetyltransferase
MFGFFECIDEQNVANLLFDAAKNWFAERDIVSMRGPANPSQNYEWGLLVEGFHSPPTFMMTYNKPYYGALIENYGFKKSQDMYAYMGHVDMLKELDPKLLFIAEEAKRRFNINVRRISKKNFKQDVKNFLHIYNAALPGQWGFTPMSAGELSATANGLKHLVVPEMTTIAEVDGKAVGAVFGLLDYHPLIKEIDGKLFPFGILKLLWKRRKITRIRLISTNVLPEYQRWGLGLVLMHRLVPDILEWGIQDAEFSWVLESNKLSRGTLERGGVKKDKTYRIYDYEGT